MDTNNIGKIVIHCSATKENQDYSYRQLCDDHKKRGFSPPCGYHIYIRRDGKIHLGRMLNVVGAHAKGYNQNTWSICYEGGLDKYGKARDTRTEAQKGSIFISILFLRGISPKAEIIGHRDLSEDKNGDGIISPNEYMKECPCFDAKEEYKELNKDIL